MRTRFNSCIKNVSNHIQKGIPRVIVKKFLFRDLRLVVAFLAVGITDGFGMILLRRKVSEEQCQCNLVQDGPSAAALIAF